MILFDGAQHRLVDAQVVQHERAGGVGAAEQRVGDGLRLVVDLLVHEGVEAALLGGGGVPVHGVALGLGGLAVEVGHGDRRRRDGHDLVLAQLEGLLGVRDERGDVGAQEVLALAEPDHERGVVPGADHGLGRVGVHGEQRERALQAAGGGRHGLRQVAGLAVRLGHEVGGHLGVGLGAERHAVGQQLGLELRRSSRRCRCGSRRGGRRRPGAGGRSRRWGRRAWPSGCARSPRWPRAAGRGRAPRSGWRACRTSWPRRRRPARARRAPPRPSRSRGTRAGAAPRWPRRGACPTARRRPRRAVRDSRSSSGVTDDPTHAGESNERSVRSP